jgi:antitoxin (DNA-binding transcriptional repressor) of toxin-antitoxin stability system
MTKSVTVTEAVRNFSDYINRVAYRHESFVLCKGNRSVAELRPLPLGRRLGDLPDLIDSLPHLSAKEASEFAADIDSARDSLPGDISNPWES